MALEFTARRSEPAARRVPPRQLLPFPLLQAITAALLFCRHYCTCTSSCYCHNHRSITIGLIIIVIITVAAAITGRTLVIIITIIITAARLLPLLLREPVHLPGAEPHLLRGTTAVTWSQ